MDLKPPEFLKLTGNVDSNWRTFKQQFKLYVAAMGLEAKPDARQIAMLLTIAGPLAIEVYNTFVYDEAEDMDKLDVVLSKFDTHCSPKKNETYERYVFRSRLQQQYEPFDSFLTDLKLKAQTCNFGTLTGSMIRDQIVFGVEDKKVRERLLRETELTLEVAIKICHASELSQLHVKTFGEMTARSANPSDSTAVGAIARRGWTERQTRPAQRTDRQTRPAQQTDEVFSCKRCGSQHKPRQCPAFGKQCSNCKGKNHFAKQCFSKRKEWQKGRNVNIVEETDLSDTFFIGIVDCEKEPVKDINAVEEDKWTALLQINETLTTVKLDTGAKANLISLTDIKEMKDKPKIHRKMLALKDYNGKSIKCLGTCRLKVKVKEKIHHLLFSVVAEGLESLLGDEACENLDLVKRVYRINTEVVLSRAPAGGRVSTTDEDVQDHVNMIYAALPVTDTKSKQIADETSKDTELHQVILNIENGWLVGSCSQFYHIRGELSVVNGLLLRQNRIIIPQSMRQDILQRIHEGHLGVEKCKRRARETVFWPGINKDIERLISRCETCQRHRNKQTKEPMLLTEVTTAPWHKVGMDLFHLKGKDYLVVIDYYSNFPEMALLSNTSSACVITHVKSIFSRHGIPNTVMSDNGPCFNSREWQEFARQYDFKHVTSSPLYAQSNGKAEKGVHILKQLLKKAADSNSDPYLALLSYRASPLECGVSPAELLMNRKLRTTLPSHSQQKHTKQKQRLKELKMKQKTFYDRTAKQLPPLSCNDTVRIEDADGWRTKATVLQEVAPRSFTVRTEEGQILRRNRRSLFKTPETVTEPSENIKDITETVAEHSEAITELIPSPPTDCNMNSSNLGETVVRKSTRTIKKPDRLNL